MHDNTPPTTKTLVVLGATSSIAHAYLRLMSAKHPSWTYILLGRSPETLDLVRKDIAARSMGNVHAIAAEIADPDAIENTMNQIMGLCESVDICLLAYGALGEQAALQTDRASQIALLKTNLVSASLWLEEFATKFAAQQTGHLVAIGSVAGDRGRQSNYLYGATKAGLEHMCEGLAHRFAASEHVNITCIKPGFVDTRMTQHLDTKGPLWAQPEQIAKAIARAVEKKRVRIYTPWFWRWIMLAVRGLPAPVFHKTKL